MKNIATIILGAFFVALALSSTEPPAQPVKAVAPPQVATQTASAPDLTHEVQQLNFMVEQQANRIAALEARLAALEQRRETPAAMKPVAQQQYTTYSAGSCASGSCGQASGRRGLFRWRR